MDRIDCTIIGAGVIGLAIARALALAGREVLVVEAAYGIGTETSSRNSEVIHAGIYYAPGSLKARLCKQGASETKGSWWDTWAAWLQERSGEQKPAPKKLGTPTFKPLAAAPGTYVHG